MENTLVLNRGNIDTSMYDYALNYGRRKNNLAALSYFGRDICFDTLISESERVANYLLDCGVRRGGSVTVCLPNTPEAVYAVYGVNRAGAVLNVVHPLINPSRLEQAIGETRSDILFVTKEYLSKNGVSDKLSSLKKIIVCSVGDSMPKKARLLYKLKAFSSLQKFGKIKADNQNIVDFYDAEAEKTYPLVKASGADAAAYMHSGGTTGVPKTVVLTNKNLNALVYNLLTAIEEGEKGYVYSDSDVMYGVLPFFHGYGLGVCLHSSICARIKIALAPRFDEKDFIKTLSREHITVMAALPNMYKRLLDREDFSGGKLKYLKNAYVGSEKMPEELKERFDVRIKEAGGTCVLEEGYGLSEAVNVCLLNRNEKYAKGSVGYPLTNTEVCVVNAQNKTLETGVTGELCVSSDTVMKGYLNDEETTKKALFSDENGKIWLKTGDLAHINEDGFVFYDGRIKRLIVISGINVFPVELEACARQLEIVSDACAVQALKNGKTVIVLNVILSGGAALNDKIKDEISAHLKKHLSKWYLPTVIIGRGEFPITPLGKTDYKALEGKID